ncbi:MAG: sugar phosphate isomerase/epimerase, partial [Caldilineaceae bacterium]|nr:sugar phosphate isomerase/epimerase [Caldilineaceae bacterium]
CDPHKETSMQIGIFPTVFPRPTLEETLDAMVALDLYASQVDLSATGLPDLPEAIDPADVARIRHAFDRCGITMNAAAGHFNMAHPDPAVRQAGLQSLRAIAGACAGFGTSIITLCTGTRNLSSMWRPHADNSTPEAWRDLVTSLETALAIADDYDLTLAFEPEVNNVIDSPQRARRIIDEMGSPRLKVVIDGANIFHKGQLPHMTRVLTEAIELVGKDIVLAHAKDLDRDGDAGHLAAGTGLLDFDLYLQLLRESGYDGAIILHGLTEAQAPGCVAFLRERLG